MEKTTNVNYLPTVFSVFKPVGMTSFDVVRHFKHNLPKGFGKIGHMGTLDPFASGLLMIGVAGATRINELVHQHLPKSYLAIGKLGFFSETGDNTSELQRGRQADGLCHVSREEIEAKLKAIFLGRYMQSPHKYSAAKYQGKPLYQWAREGVDIEKERVEREIFKIEVVKFSYPYLSIRFVVSSGTYIRTLFADCAAELGSNGVLIGLLREGIGPISFISAIKRKDWPVRGEDYNRGLGIDEILPFEKVILAEDFVKKYSNGNPIFHELAKDGHHLWIYDHKNKMLGLGQGDGKAIKVVFNLAGARDT